MLAICWAIVPLFNSLYFAIVPLYPIVAEHEKMSVRGLASQKIFWVLLLLMIGAGASEAAMSLWASAFAESALHVSKMVASAFLCILCYLLAGLSKNPVWGLLGCAVCGFSVGIF